MSEKKPQLSIVIPFMDEEKRLPNSLRKVIQYVDRHLPGTEIVLVDDGSVDRTVEVIEDYLKRDHVQLVTHAHNKGKGAAIRSGILAAAGKYILFTDADLSTPIKDVQRLLEHIKEHDCDITMGSRALPQSNITTPQPLRRVLIGRGGNLVIRFFMGLPFKDTQCGFKLFTSEAAKKLFSVQYFERWSFDIEVLYKAKKFGYKACEVAVEWGDVGDSKVRAGRDSLRVLMDVLRIRLMYDKYDEPQKP